ncbi:MAG: dTMP kinase [Clostridia bacterium]|nr:dTMP kinase [Clostridia bacterium]
MSNKDCEKAGRGRFIVFEGIDGSGKSSQMRELAKRLTKSGKKVITTAEPTGSAIGVFIRSVLGGEIRKTEEELAALFALDRIYHNKEIEKYLEEGIDVLCDRYYYSSLAYQGSETDIERIKKLNLDRSDIRVPDICIFVDVSTEVALQRILGRGNKTEIYETSEKLDRVRKRFFEVFEMMKTEGRKDAVCIVDNSGSFGVAAEKVFQSVEKIR